MNEKVMNPINIIRSARRSEIRDLRNKHKELLFCNRRVRLQEVSAYVHDVTLSELNELLLKLKQKSVTVDIIRKIRNSCVNNENIEAVFRNDGAFTALIRILTSNNAEKKLEAVACFTNLSCGPHKCSYKVAKLAGAYLISFINGNNYFLQNQSTWTIANIANDCVECFNIIKNQGVLPALFKSLKSPLSDVQSVAFALNACTNYDDPEIISLIQSNLPRYLLLLLEKENFSSCIFREAAFAISNCCFLSVKYSLGTFDVEFIERIINILFKVIQAVETDILIITPLVRCLGFLSYDERLGEFISTYVDFYKIIEHTAADKNYIYLVKEVLWLLCNVAVSTDIFANTVDVMSLINVFATILKLEKSVTLKVLYCLAILASKNEHIHLQLTQHEIFTEIKSLLESEEKDVIEATQTFLDLYNL